jgi:hypothetical protein
MKKNNRIFQLLKNNLISQKGMALLATLIFVFILTGFGIALLTMTRNDIKLSTLQEESTKAFYLADAGVERAINWLEKQGTPPSAADIPPVNFDGDHEFDELNTGKYTVLLSIGNPTSTVAGYIIETEGWITRADASRVSRKIKTMVTISNFAEYAYFSDQELFPSNSNISGSGSYAGQKIWFIGDDIFGGKVHSNSQFHMVDEPNFYGKVTSMADTIEFWGGAHAADGHDFPNFHDGYDLGAENYIELPQFSEISNLDDAKSLQRIAGGSLGKSGIQALPSNVVYVPSVGGMGTQATGGIYVKGNVTSINLDVDNAAEPNSKMTFVQGGNTTTITSVLSPITLPTGSTLNEVAAGGTIIPANTTLVKKSTGVNAYESYQGISNGLLFVDGSINDLNGNNQRGKMTIASNESINITNNILYYDRDETVSLLNDEHLKDIDDSLGLVAAKDVKIASNAPYNIEVDAIIMALNTSFFYAGWQQTPAKGTLSLLGGLIQKQRGPVGTHNAGVKVTGYSKNYQYDTRMANPAGGNLPPYFPSTGQYQKAYWKEVY